MNMNICMGWGSCNHGLLLHVAKGEWWWEMLTFTIAVLGNNLLSFLFPYLCFSLLGAAHRVVSWVGKERTLFKFAQHNTLLKKKINNQNKTKIPPASCGLNFPWKLCLNELRPLSPALSLSAGEKGPRSLAWVPWLWPRSSGPRLVQLLCFQWE